jgi:uncharacterized protein (TIGR03435 family)
MMKLLLFAIASVAYGQSAFEVASIRVAPCPCRVLHSFSPSGANVTFEGYTWIDLVTEAYNLKSYEVSVPDALVKAFNFDIFYNVVAKAEGDAPRTPAEFRAMLQSLLTDRFHLKFHRETKEMQVYAMVVGKGGIKFRESDPDVQRSARVTVNGRNQKLTATHMTMDTLSTNLYVRPVIDRTGLKGEYDIVLEATPEFRINNNPQPDDISIFTAIQDSLGLKLEQTRAAVEILVIDSIEKPSEN